MVNGYCEDFESNKSEMLFFAENRARINSRGLGHKMYFVLYAYFMFITP